MCFRASDGGEGEIYLKRKDQELPYLNTQQFKRAVGWVNESVKEDNRLTDRQTDRQKENEAKTETDVEIQTNRQSEGEGERGRRKEKEGKEGGRGGGGRGEAKKRRTKSLPGKALSR